ncbi:hypothetical protein D1007_37310 [Hordeum vulgare]|nr:hypothetical protein D1007_37310 [Hordeum vulgare]
MLAAGATAVVAPVRARRRHALAIVAARAQRATALAALSRLLMDSDPLDVPRSKTNKLALFYSDLMAAFSSRWLKRRAMDYYAQLRRARGRGRGGAPGDGVSGVPADAFQFGLVAKCYGKAGQLAEMERAIASMSDAGIRLVVCCAGTPTSDYFASQAGGWFLQDQRTLPFPCRLLQLRRARARAPLL